LAWRPEGHIWTPAYYATPYVILVVTALALYAPREQSVHRERKLAFFLATAAAATSLVPITLLRSDEPHFLGPALALSVVIALSVTMLPSLLIDNMVRREGMRVVFLIVFTLIYAAPQGLKRIVTRVTPDIGQAWRGTRELVRFFRERPQLTSASLMERRSGFRMTDGAPGLGVPMRLKQYCYYYFEATCGEVREFVEEIRDRVKERTVFLDVGPGQLSSLVYFFGDLNVQISKPELFTTIWIRQDLAQLRAELARNPPECVVSWGRGAQASFLLGLYGRYTTGPIQHGFVYCRD
jgi:hypothetical protein